MNNFGMKELYDVSLKTTYSIEMEGRIIEPGETIAVFDKIQIAALTEDKTSTSAKGGYDNRGLIWWEETQDVKLRLSQGIFSKSMLALMSNASLVTSNSDEPVLINQRERVETDESGIATIKHVPAAPIFVYDATTAQKITNYDISGNQIIIPTPYLDIIVDYWYPYQNKATVMTVGRPLISGYLSLTGKTRVKDEVTGQVKTGIINIPKLKLMSDLSMRLGDNATPIVGQLDALAIPVGNRGNKKVMEILFLEDDIDSDM